MKQTFSTSEYGSNINIKLFQPWRIPGAQIHWLTTINVDLSHLYPGTSWDLAWCHVIISFSSQRKMGATLKFCSKSPKGLVVWHLLQCCLWFSRLALIIFLFSKYLLISSFKTIYTSGSFFLLLLVPQCIHCSVTIGKLYLRMFKGILL